MTFGLSSVGPAWASLFLQTLLVVWPGPSTQDFQQFCTSDVVFPFWISLLKAFLNCHFPYSPLPSLKESLLTCSQGFCLSCLLLLEKALPFPHCHPRMPGEEELCFLLKGLETVCFLLAADLFSACPFCCTSEGCCGTMEQLAQSSLVVFLPGFQ